MAKKLTRNKNRTHKRKIVKTRKIRGGACGACAQYTPEELQVLREKIGLSESQHELLSNIGVKFADINAKAQQFKDMLPDYILGHFWRWNGHWPID